MRFSLRSLLHRFFLLPALLCSCRIQVTIPITLGLLVFPAALQAQTLTYLGMRSTVSYTNELAPVSVATDSQGNLYIADASLASIVKIAPDGTQTSIGTGLVTPIAVAVDNSGNVYVTQFGVNQVVEISAVGMQSVVPFSGLVSPFGVAVDSSGAVYVADEENGVVYKLPTSGPQTTVGDNLDVPAGLAFDSAGNLYIADAAGPVYKIAGGIQTQIGSGFYSPQAVSVDARGVVYVADGNFPAGDLYEIEGNTPVRLNFGPVSGVAISASGGVYVVPSDGSVVSKLNLGSVDFGSANVCPGTAATPAPCSQSVTLNFVVPATQISVAFADPSDLTVTNGGQHLDFTTTANTCTGTSSGATPCSVTIQFKPLGSGIRSGALDISGVLNGGPPGSLITVPIHGLGLASLASFDSELISTLPLTFRPEVFVAGVTPDSAGNLYTADGNSCVIQKWTAATNVLSTIAGTGACGSSEASNGVLATAATFSSVWKPAVDGRGNVYFSDISNSVIWKVDAITGYANIIAGTLQTPGQSGDGGLAANALFNRPYGMASDAAGDLYVTDYRNETVRRIDGVTSVVTTIAGNYPGGQSGSSGDGGLATSALLNDPDGVALDSFGNVYIADTDNNAIRRVDAVTGIISTVAGQVPPATFGYSGDGEAATAALLDSPEAVAVDAAGNLYIADSSNLVVRKVNAATGFISTIAGVFTASFDGGNGTDTGDGGAATLGTFSYLLDLSIDSSGNLYLDDPFNAVVRKITSASGNLLFGSSPVGTATTYQSAALTNNGNLPLNLSDLSIPQNFEPDLTQFNCHSQLPYAPSTGCILAFDFVPTTTGLLTGAVTLTDDDPSLTQSFSLTGTGTSTAAGPAKVVLGSYPASVSLGGNLGLLFMSVETASGTVVLAPTSPIQLTITGPGGFSYHSSVTTLAGTGIAFLTSVPFTTPGMYSIVASLGELTPGTGSFTVTSAVVPPPPALDKLAFAALPSAVAQGDGLGSIPVFVEQSSGLIDASSAASVTVTITGPAGYTRTATASAASGVATFDLSADSFATAGAYSIAATSSGLASVTASFAVQQGFTLSTAGSTSGGGASSTQTVAPGAAAVFPLTLAPAGSSFTLPITLTASGLPPGATYTFSPDVVTPGRTPATSKLIVQTASTTAAVHRPDRRGAGLGELALAFLLLPFAASRKLRRTVQSLPRLGLILALLSLGAIAGLTGCAAGGLFANEPASYTITVTGTSGHLVHTTTVTLIEQ